VTFKGLPDTDPGAPDPPEEWRWGRTTASAAQARYHPIRDDWHSEPNQWDLLAVANVPSIPETLRPALQQLDCVIPRFHYGSLGDSVVWGEFEHAGRRDIAVLCVHADHSSSTYMFWNADPAKREEMPGSGNSISIVPRSQVDSRGDVSLPLQPDMPRAANHDAIDIGCCECCSTIFYRYQGKWFTLPGAD
jgi:hypothetical protein